VVVVAEQEPAEVIPAVMVAQMAATESCLVAGLLPVKALPVEQWEETEQDKHAVVSKLLMLADYYRQFLLLGAR
jgi:hypothetical protein